MRQWLKNNIIRYRTVIMLFCSLHILANSAENVQNNNVLHFLYTSPIGSWFRSLITYPWFSYLSGWYADSRISRVHIRHFIKKHRIPMYEAIEPNPKKYRSFNDFFTRALKPEARPIDQHPRSITSPVDGSLYLIDNLNKDSWMIIKEKKFNVASFLRDETLAQNYYGGMAFIIYLAPWDYHRFHFPIDSKPSKTEAIHGTYHAVSPFMYYQTTIQPLYENERHKIVLKTTKGKHLIFMPVGALCVGRITEHYIPGNRYQKGDEAGYFSFGGSTVVLLIPPHFAKATSTIKPHTFTPIKMGEAIAYQLE